MFMHPHQAGNHRLVRQRHPLSSGRYLNLIGRAGCLDAAALDHDGLVFPRRRACSIQYPHVLQRNHRRIHGDERLQAGRELRLSEQSKYAGCNNDP